MKNKTFHKKQNHIRTSINSTSKKDKLDTVFLYTHSPLHELGSSSKCKLETDITIQILENTPSQVGN